jgi:hypothetical protein
MTNHAKTELIEEAYKSFCKYPLDSLELLTSIPDNDKEYQCILLLSPNPESPFLTLHQATSDKHIPVYDVSSVWSHHNIESKFKVDTVALGVPRDKASVDLAVSLWRCHLYLKNKSMST